MNGFNAFFVKELLHTLRSLRLVIIVVVFFVLGIMNAPLAKLTPEILELAGVGDLMGELVAPAPTALDAWAQFFGNVSQMGIIAILLLCGGMLSGERSRGTLILPLTKGLGRISVVLTKFIVMAALWTIGILIAALTSWACTVVLFPDGSVSHLALSIFFLWLFGVFLLALLLLSSVLFRGSMSGLILPGGVLFILLVLSAFPDLFFWSPLLLTSNGPLLLAEMKVPLDFLVPCVVALIIAAVTFTAALIRFRKASI